MRQLFYRIIYQSQINFILRNLNKYIKPLLPDKTKLPPSGTINLRNSDGSKLKMRTNQTSYLTQLIFWGTKKYSFEYVEIFRDLIKNIGVFYDVGANIGYYSLIAAAENKDIQVIAFEPASGPLFYLRENVRINKFKNITIEPLALAEADGETKFFEVTNKKYRYLKHNLSGESNAGSKISGRNYKTCSVKIKKLDGYFKESPFGQIDLMKLDTEGTEHLILEHAQEVISSMKPIIICETLFSTIEHELENIMKSHNYLFFNHTERGLVEVSSIIRKEDDGVRNCFFVHPSKYEMIKNYVTKA